MGPYKHSSGSFQTISIKLVGPTAQAFLGEGESVTDDGGSPGHLFDLPAEAFNFSVKHCDSDKVAVLAG
jgi:hypothetical protein